MACPDITFLGMFKVIANLTLLANAEPVRVISDRIDLPNIPSGLIYGFRGPYQVDFEPLTSKLFRA